MKRILYPGTLLLLVCLSACGGLFPAPTPSPTTTLVPATLTASPTIVWFPPTDTPTFFPSPTIEPTLEQLPGLGSLLFADNFSQPDLWNLSTATWASAAINQTQLVLSINGQGPVSLLSLRSQPTVGDFYAEATATLSLCGAQDQYGMVFRAAPGGYDYRFVLSCDGAIRIARSNNGSATPLMNWIPTGDAPTGPPASVKLGVWAVGGELRFFLNGNYQFTFNDPVLHVGTLGFFVYVNDKTPITISFSDLAVYSVSYIPPTPSPVPSRSLTPSRTPTP